MSEDEDVVLVGSPLYNYFREQHISDFEDVKHEVTPPTAMSPSPAKPAARQVPANESTYNWCLRQVMQSELMLREDHESLEYSVLSETPVTLHVASIKMATCLALSAITVFACRKIDLPILFGLPMLVPVGKTLLTDYNNYKVRRNLTKHLLEIQRLHKNLRYVFGLTMDYNTALAMRFPCRVSTETNLPLSQYPKALSNQFSATFHQVIYFLNNSSRSIMKEVSADVPEYFHELIDLPLFESDLQKVFNRYILSVSEYVKTLGVCYATLLWVNGPPAYLDTLNFRTLPEITINLELFSSELERMSSTFKKLMFNNRLPQKINDQKHPIQKESYIFTYHAGTHCHIALNALWTVADTLENLKSVNPQEAEKLYNLMEAARKSLGDTNTFLQLATVRLSHLCDTGIMSSSSSGTTSSDESCPDLEQVSTNASEHNGEVGDEFFECTIPKEEDGAGAELDAAGGGFAEESPARPPFLLNELRGALAVKAAEWAAREAKVRARHGTAPELGDEEATGAVLKCTTELPVVAGRKCFPSPVAGDGDEISDGSGDEVEKAAWNRYRSERCDPDDTLSRPTMAVSSGIQQLLLQSDNRPLFKEDMVQGVGELSGDDESHV